MRNSFYAVVLVSIITGAIAACSAGGVPAAAQPAVQSNVIAPPGTKTFVFDPAQSEVHFIINEVLSGAPNTVIGKTNKVTGQIFASYANPSATSISPISVDLSGLATDSGMRNRMIQGSILETGNPAYQFAVFSMTRLDGLPARVTLGQPFDFQITGNLALHGVTKQVTFDATVTPVSDTQLKGKASLTVQYADWGVQVLRLPQQVASVADKTILEIVFVANAQ